MRLKELHIAGFKSFAKKTALSFDAPITAIVGPNGSGKSNTAEAFRFALGEQSMKSMRGKRGEDLIWDGSRTLPRGNRASVKVVFDNSSRRLGLDFEEVSIERTVFRDASHEYAINGTRVRLKDILEILAGANIGATGHHIISQGEADRILLASPRERKAILEEALGLRLYHFRKADAEKKRAETAANRKEAQVLRREIAPHLNFLKKQVERAEEATRLKARLITRYRAYFAAELAVLEDSKGKLAIEKRVVEKHLATLQTESEKDKKEERREELDLGREEVSKLERALADIRARRETEARSLGRLEGRLAALEEVAPPPVSSLMARDEVAIFVAELDEALVRMAALDDPQERAQALERIRGTIAVFRERVAGTVPKREPSEDPRRDEVIRERDALVQAIAALAHEEAVLIEKKASLERTEALARREAHERERHHFAREAALREASRQLADVAAREAHNREKELVLKREQGEAAISFGREVIPDDAEIAQDAPHVDVREIERMKAALEAIDPGASEAVIREYEATRERDAFLARELADLEQADKTLAALIRDLDVELSRKFAEGVKATSERFHELFALMFDGGRAALTMSRVRPRGATEEGETREEGEDPAEIGTDIEVALPRKKTKGLHALSGGERALTAIALTFAIAQVNPPPFLILDETDAALDEANSRRYGDMIERIAEHSQLILITHNRETMSRAGVLYGVTMGADGASELLSVKLDEALAVAK
jgi:chromosome segregation protein